MSASADRDEKGGTIIGVDIKRAGYGQPERSAESDSSTVVILAPMNVEYKAVRHHLRELHQTWHPEGTAFEVGTVPGVPWRVAIAVTGTGNLETAVVAIRAAAQFRPRAMFVVGIAGGLRDDIELGDVVVATWVYGHHSGKADARGFSPRPRAWRGAHDLEQAARVADIKGTWAHSLPDLASPAVHFAPIAAGEVVLNSRDTTLARQLERHYEDAAAIEMESAGAASAAHMNTALPILTIRGISDKADGNKYLNDAAGLQPIAASHAAAFTMALLDELAAASRGSGGTGGAAPGASAGAEPAQDTFEAEVTWRPSDQPLLTAWLSELGAPRAAASAILELHLMPARHSTRLEARRLAALKDELTALGRAENMFGPAEEVLCRDPATVGSAAGRGLAVTHHGQRSAWQPLPQDTLGAVLDPADTLSRLTALLDVLLQIRMPDPGDVGLAVGVTGYIPVSEGRPSDLPRSACRRRTSMPPVRVPAADVLPYTHLTSRPRDIAEELAARLLAAFRARTA